MRLLAETTGAGVLSTRTVDAGRTPALEPSIHTVEGDTTLARVPYIQTVEAGGTAGLREELGIPNDFPGGKFFMYSGPYFEYLDVTELYRITHHGMNIWDNERKDTVQDTGEIWLYRSLLQHPNRTFDPEEADLFYVPAFMATSYRMKNQGFRHYKRILNMTNALMEMPYLQRHQGADHLYICTWWRCGAALEAARVLLNVNRTSLLATMERITTWSHWKCPERLVIIPYVANVNVTQDFSATPFSERSITFFFVGCARHGRHERATVRALSDLDSAHIQVPGSCDNFTVGPEEYAALIKDSKFCMVPRGDSYTTRRLFDAVAAGCIPIIQDGGIRRSLPFAWKLDYSQFALFVTSKEYQSSAALRARCSRLLQQPVERFERMQRVLLSVRSELVWGQGDVLGPGARIGNVGDNVLYEAMWKSLRLKSLRDVSTAACLGKWPNPHPGRQL